MDFSQFAVDEWAVLIGAAVVAFTLLSSWYAPLMSVTSLGNKKVDRTPLLLLPLVAIFFLCVIMITLADPAVRANLAYVILYVLLGVAWMRFSLWGFLYMGLSLRDDLVERRNNAAAIAVGGALIAIVFCYAGGNIGAGPAVLFPDLADAMQMNLGLSWLIVVLCAVLATGGLFLLWMGLNAITNVTEGVTIDRDAATAVRLAAFLIGVGLILGRAVAGNWVSLEATIADYVRYGWPALALFAIAVAGEFLLKPTKERPIGNVIAQGIAPGILYLGIAIFFVFFLMPLHLAAVAR